jgi:hypothetical protein
MQQYPFDIPTEAFPFEIFKQAFVAVQSCVVHLQKVSLARRFALVPLGPPLLTYKSNCKAMLTAVGDSVRLVVDRPYKAGEPIIVWYNIFFRCIKILVVPHHIWQLQCLFTVCIFHFCCLCISTVTSSYANCTGVGHSLTLDCSSTTVLLTKIIHMIV